MKTSYVQEVSSDWLRVRIDGFGELLQVSKIMSVQETEGGGCLIHYYDPLENRRVEFTVEESFEDIAKQLGC